MRRESYHRVSKSTRVLRKYFVTFPREEIIVRIGLRVCAYSLRNARVGPNEFYNNVL